MFVKYIEDFLSRSECDNIIELGKSIGLDKMTSAKFVNGIYIERKLDENHNKRMGCYFGKDELGLSEIKSISNKVISKLNNLKCFNGIQYVDIPKYSFNQYSKDDFLDWHSDSHEIMYGASLTVIFQLNDDYIGGDVMYMIDDIEYRVPKKQGSILIFDSNILHCVEKLNSGIRYSLNVWPSSLKKVSLI